MEQYDSYIIKFFILLLLLIIITDLRAMSGLKKTSQQLYMQGNG